MKPFRTAIIEIKDKNWFPYLLLFLITALAAGLRFYKLGEWSFWIDEIYTINHAQAHFSSIELLLSHIPPARIGIPLSVIFTAQVVNLLGVSEWSARLVSAVIGILTIPILFFPLKKIFSSPVTLIALLLLAVSPWHIFWSQNARFYTLLMLLYSLALFTFYFGIEKNRPLYFAVFYVIFYFAFSERMLAVLLIPVIAVYLLALWVLPVEKPAGFNSKNLLITSTPIASFLLFQLVSFAANGRYLFSSDIADLAPPIDNPVRLLVFIFLSMGIPIAAFGLFSGLYLLQKRERDTLFLFIGAVIPIVTLMAINPFVFTLERYALVAFPFWLILASYGVITIFLLVKDHRAILAAGILSIFLLDAGTSSLLYYQINHGNRLNWKEAVKYVSENMEDSDIVISTRAEIVQYYLRDEILDYTRLTPVDLGRMENNLWFIIDFPGIWHGNHSSKEWMEAHTSLIKFSYLRVPEENSILIYHSAPRQ